MHTYKTYFTSQIQILCKQYYTTYVQGFVCFITLKTVNPIMIMFT